MSSCTSFCSSQFTKIADFIAPVNPVTERRGMQINMERN
jgi:hypothetical protein